MSNALLLNHQNLADILRWGDCVPDPPTEINAFESYMYAAQCTRTQQENWNEALSDTYGDIYETILSWQSRQAITSALPSVLLSWARIDQGID